MDNLLYKYNLDANGKKINNKLNFVAESEANRFGTGVDLLNNATATTAYNQTNTSTHNYTYDAIGQLIEDKSEGIKIEWRVDGKVKQITKTKTKTTPNVIITFEYPRYRTNPFVWRKVNR